MALLDDILANLGGGQAGQGTVLAPQQTPPPQAPPQNPFTQALSGIGSVLQQIGGHFVDTLGVVSAIDRGNLSNYLMNQQLATQDPTLRSRMETSPFFRAEMGQWGNLPPLGAEAQALQAKQQLQADILTRAQAGDPQAMALAGLPMSPQQQQQYAQTEGIGQPGGPSRVVFGPHGPVTTFGQVGGAIGPMEFPTQQAAAAAGATYGAVAVPTNRGTWTVRVPRPPTPGTGVDYGVPPPAQPAPAQATGQPPPEAAQPAPTEAQPAQPAQPDAEGWLNFDDAVRQEQQPQEAGRVGYPSPAFVDPAGIVKNRESPTQFAQRPDIQAAAARTGVAAPIPATPQPAAAPATPVLSVGGVPLPKPGPGERQRAVVAPGVTIERSGPPIKEEAQVQIRTQMLGQATNLLAMGKGAVNRLIKKGILTNGVTGAATNFVRLQWYARTQGDKDAAFLVNNLRAAVPLLARGMGEASRPNMREEQRLAESLAGIGMDAKGLLNVLDNYQQILTTGRATPFLMQNFPESVHNLKGSVAGIPPEELKRMQAQQQFLEDAEPVQ